MNVNQVEVAFDQVCRGGFDHVVKALMGLWVRVTVTVIIYSF